MNASQLIHQLEQEVLPALFRRLDRAFPEFQWSRTTIGWTGVRQSTRADQKWRPATTVNCNQPWGYVSDDGRAVSWLAYVLGNWPKRSAELSDGIRKLAKLAGVSLGSLQHLNNDDWGTVADHLRQTDLLETFVAHCYTTLTGASGQHVRYELKRQHIVAGSDLRDVSLGLFSSNQEVGDQLVNAGFQPQEILDAMVASDPRLAGRLIIPWRDAAGTLKTIVARELTVDARPIANDLYLKGGTKLDVFGLDVALQQDADKSHLVLVDHVYDVLYLHSLGVKNVATVDSHDESIAAHHWESLAACGVDAVTIATERSLHDATIVASTRHSNSAESSPEIFAVQVGNAKETAASYVRQHGVDAFARRLESRRHAYTLVAEEMIARHNPRGGWNDAGMTNLLVEAVNFDAEAIDAHRANQLEQHFWPEILEATKLDWSAVRAHLKRRSQSFPDGWSGHWQLHNLQQLVRDLDDSLSQANYVRFRDLILACARDLNYVDEPIVPTVLPYPEQASTPEVVVLDQEPASKQTPPAKSPTWQPLVRHHWDRFPYVNKDAPKSATTTSRPAARSPRQFFVDAGEVRKLAYRLWESAGRPEGCDHDFWLLAEEKLKRDRATVVPVRPRHKAA